MRSDNIAYQSRTIRLAPHAGQNVVSAPAARRRGRRPNRSTRIRHAAQSPPSEPPAADAARGTTPVCAHGSSAGQSWPAVRRRWPDRTRRLRRPGRTVPASLPESETTIIMTPPHIISIVASRGVNGYGDVAGPSPPLPARAADGTGISCCVAKCAPKRRVREHRNANDPVCVSKCARSSFRRALRDANRPTTSRRPRANTTWRPSLHPRKALNAAKYAELRLFSMMIQRSPRNVTIRLWGMTQDECRPRRTTARAAYGRRQPGRRPLCHTLFRARHRSVRP